MSLPQRPWPQHRIFMLKKKADDMELRADTKPGPYRRLRKRAERLTNRWIALWFQLKDIDPHAPASTTSTGEGTRKPRRRAGQ